MTQASTYANRVSARSNGSADILFYMVVAAFVLQPAFFLGREIGGGWISASLFLSIAAGGIAYAMVLAHQIKLITRQFQIVAWFLPFLFLGVLSILVSPFAGAIFARGLSQVIGMAAMLGMVILVIQICADRPDMFIRLLRWGMGGAAVIGGLAVFQFLVNNIVRAGVIDFSLLNALSSEDMILPANLVAGLYRAHVFANEPSHLGLFLSAFLGPALIRLRVLGRGWQMAIRPFVRLRVAVLITGGIFVTISSVAYMGMLATMLGLIFFLPRLSVSKLLLVTVMIVGLVGGLVLLLGGGDSDFLVKLASLGIVGDVLANRGLDRIATEEVSALALATNLFVTVQNLQAHPLLGVGLGGHPVAFANNDLALFDMVPLRLLYLNSQDAASLLLRLLSETGILGTGAFFLFTAALFLQVRRSIAGFLILAQKDARFLGMVAVGMGLGGSFLGVFLSCLGRLPFYYGGPLWITIAMASAVAAAYHSRLARQSRGSADVGT
ncbi:hypothetical protein [Niveispirillum irakense]|uniref:hypothetical protein n=1 Tax=Niveispirillum irakense TaxID=34011 RepID=UPI0003FD4BBE|nr:hypothetical protein [Niveispirillum irakense]